MKPIIEVQNLSKKYKERKILEAISFQISEGESTVAYCKEKTFNIP